MLRYSDSDGDNKGRRRRYGTSNMADRKRAFSPKYRPLEEEHLDPPEEIRTDDDSPVHDASSSMNTARSRHVSDSDSRNREERVIILSDHDVEGANGDADSGISLSEVVGEDHLVSAKLLGRGEKTESLLMLVVQIIIPFIFAGFGMMAAGLLLDAVQVSVLATASFL